jgi:hypothetical protein
MGEVGAKKESPRILVALASCLVARLLIDSRMRNDPWESKDA